MIPIAPLPRQAAAMRLVRAPWVLAAAIAAGLSGCAATGSSEDAAETPPAAETAQRLVGRISSIRANPHFVLIESYGSWDVPTGAVLTSRGEDGRTANLIATGERAGQYAAADVRAGEVALGDAVFFMRPAAEAAAPPSQAGRLTEDPEDEEEPAGDLPAADEIAE
jgi:hypothetical protein